MRKGLIIRVIVTAIMFMCGCGLFQDKPRVVVENYLKAIYSNDHKTAYTLISSLYKNFKTENEYLREVVPKDVSSQAIANMLSSLVKYKVGREEVKGDRATVQVTLTVPDSTKIMGSLLASAFLNEEPDRAMEEKMKELFVLGEVPITEKKESFRLVKEKAGWRIFVDWEKEKKAQQKQAYIKEVGISPHYSLTSTQTFLDDGLVVDRSFEAELPIVNRGNRILTQVEITFFFLDEEGHSIHEKKYYPVSWPSSMHLEPYSIKDFKLQCKDIPSEYAKINIEITNIELAEWPW